MPIKDNAPPLPPDFSLFEMPPVEISEEVLVDANPQWRHPTTAWVVAKSDNAIAVAGFTERGMFYRWNCVHRTDPRCELQQDRFSENQSGVWEKSPRSLRLERIEKELRELRVLMGNSPAARVNPPRVPVPGSVQPPPSRRPPSREPVCM